MDRSITIPASRPVAILDEHIDVAFPQYGATNPQGSTTLEEDIYIQQKRQQWLNHVKLRLLQSEIYAVNFSNTNTLSLSHSEWMQDMDRRLQLWKEDVVGMSESGPDWFDFVMSTVQFYLHMPCPRNPTPAEKSKLICFDAASTTLCGYLGMMQSGFLKFDWHCAHQCYPSALLIIENAPFYVKAFSKARVTALLDQFSDAFVSV